MSFVVPPIDLNDPLLDIFSEEYNRRFEEQRVAGQREDNREPSEAEPWDSEAWGEVFCDGLLRALNHNAVCWHSFQDDEGGVLRSQAYMPVSASYELVPWSRLPHNFDQCYDLLIDGDDPDFERWYRDPYGMLARAGAAAEKLHWNIFMAYSGPPEPPSSSRWAWVEFEPQIASITECYFRWLREATDMSPSQREGTLEFLYKDRRLSATVVLAHENDSRIYFNKVRPLIRPKNAAQYRELGLSPT